MQGNRKDRKTCFMGVYNLAERWMKTLGLKIKEGNVSVHLRADNIKMLSVNLEVKRMPQGWLKVLLSSVHNPCFPFKIK